MLQVIVLSVCRLVEPAHCKDVHLQIEPEFGESLQLPFNCMRQGQIQGQKWLEENPGWRIVGWKCPSVERKREEV